jgi:antirestriction protein ArdC/phage/plasmid primase-like uncharacterized protein
MNKDFRTTVAEEMLRHIEAGTARWQRGWDPGLVRVGPFNPTTKAEYRGINSWWLDLQGHSDPRWMTYRQAQAVDAQIRKGEHGTHIEYWQWSEKREDQEGNKVEVRLARPKVFLARVFNAEQIDGLEPYQSPSDPFLPVANAELVLQNGGVAIHHDGKGPHYAPSSDSIHLPQKPAFNSAYEYYATALHELGHATGHSSRLHRQFGPFGSLAYGVEELRAEMASYALTTELGLGHYPERHAGYVESWMTAIRADKNVLFRAARDAETIHTWITEPERRQELARLASERSQGQEVGVSSDQVEEQAKGSTFVVVKEMPSRDEVAAYLQHQATAHQERQREIESEIQEIRSQHMHTKPEPLTDKDGERDRHEYELLQDSGLLQTKTEIERIQSAIAHAEFEFLGKVRNVLEIRKLTSELDALNRDYKPKYELLVAPKLLTPEQYEKMAGAKNVKTELHNETWRKAQAVTPEQLDEMKAAVVDVAATAKEFAFAAEGVRRGWGHDPQDFAHIDLNSSELDRRVIQSIHAFRDEMTRETGPVEDLSQEEFEQERQEEKAMTAEPSEKTRRVYLAVPFDEKDRAKAAGAHWDRRAKSWYVNEGTDMTSFAAWSEHKPAPVKLSPSDEFAAALNGHGLLVEGNPVMDGKWHRVAIEGDRKGQMSGSYRGFLDGVPNGTIVNFKRGEPIKWVATGIAIDPAERDRLKAESEQRRQVQEEEQKKLRHQTAKKAFGVWEHAREVGTSGYFEGKGIEDHPSQFGLKLDDKGNVLVPMRDGRGYLWNLQVIAPDGQKRFLTGGRKSGLMHMMGRKNDLEKPEASIIVAEGMATAIRLRQAVEPPVSVAVAFDAGNLDEVAKGLRKQYPSSRIFIAADDDHKLVHQPPYQNVGLVKAAAAAQAVKGDVIKPPLTDLDRENGLTDFDDIARKSGLAVVAKVVKKAIAPEKAPQKAQRQRRQQKDQEADVGMGMTV